MTRNNAEFNSGKGGIGIQRLEVYPTDPDTGKPDYEFQPNHPAVFPTRTFTAAELVNSGQLHSAFPVMGEHNTLRPEHMQKIIDNSPRPNTKRDVEDIARTGVVQTPIEIHSWSTDNGELTELADGHHRLAAMYLHHPDKPIPVKWVDRTPNA